MDAESLKRTRHVERLSELLALVQDAAHKLADASHGRTYDQIRELEEILRLARLQVDVIQADAVRGAPQGLERRSSPRSRFGDLN